MTLATGQFPTKVIGVFRVLGKTYRVRTLNGPAYDNTGLARVGDWVVCQRFRHHLYVIRAAKAG